MAHSKKPARTVLFWILLLSTLTLNISCESSDPTTTTAEGEVAQTGEQNPSEPPIPPVPPVAGPAPTVPPIVTTPTPAPAPPVAAPPAPSGHHVDQIKAIAANSSCASYNWLARGKAPAAYMKGMALTYARSYCRLKTTLAAPTTLATLLSRSAGSPTTDALAHYGISSPSGEEALRSLYTLGVGLGMRESAGRYCEGRDMSASNTSADTAEAGLFQTSYDSFGASAELSKLYAEYRAKPSKCFLEVFQQGVSCRASSISGSGAGADYQAFNKSCPAFAAEYAMVMLRVRRNHYGPINRKEAEVVPVCNQMLKSVQSYIDVNPYACDDIL